MNLTRIILLSLLALANVTDALVADGAKRQLNDGWEFYQGSLGSPWEVWRGDAASDKHGEQTVSEHFGVRSFEWVENPPRGNLPFADKSPARFGSFADNGEIRFVVSRGPAPLSS